MKHIENKIIAISAAALLLATACNRIDDIAGGLQNMGFDAKVVSTQVADGWELIGADDGTGPAESFLTDEAGTMSFPVTCEVMDAVDAPVTKGSLINYNDDSSHGKQALSGYLTEFKAYAYDGTNNFFTKATGNFEIVTYSSGKWSASHTYKWPDETELQIFAYANAPDSLAKITMSKDSPHMSSRLEYKIPQKAGDQNDILLGTYCGKGDRSVTDVATAPIEFKHPLTCVRIKIEEAELAKLGAIKKISLIGLIENYVFNMTYSSSYGGASSGCKFDYIVYQDKDGGLDIDEDGYIGVPFIIAPQDIKSKPVSLKVETVSGITLYATLSNDGNKLDAGKVNVFSIGYDNNVYVFNLVGDSDVLTYKNTTKSETQAVTLVSYRHPLGNPSSTEPVKFKAEYSIDDGASWERIERPFVSLSGFSKENDGCITPADFSLTASARTTYIPDPDSHFKWENESYGPMLDLSTVDANGDPTGYTNSANCYVIHHPGEYKIPLVYGNALQNGTINPDAYSTSNSGDRILSTFLNCFGTPITNGWILTDLSGRYSNAKACLLWQDAWEGKSGSNPGVGFITEVGIDGNYITFKTATGANLIESNAMIALYDEKGSNNQYDEGVDQILWSWHIWASEENFSPAGCQKTSSVVEFAPVNLGFCKGRKVIYKVQYDSYRQVLIRLTQLQGHAAPIIITVNRPDAVSALKADCPTYQNWRKDPIRAISIPSGSNNGTVKKWYTIDGTSIPKAARYFLPEGFSEDEAFAEEISHPHLFVEDNTSGYTRVRTYVNLWSMQNTLQDSSNEVSNQKTIYDPCPYGFKVPPLSAINIFKEITMYSDSKPDRAIFVYGEVEFIDPPYYWWWEDGLRETGGQYLNSSVAMTVATPKIMCIHTFSPINGSTSSTATSSATHALLPIRDTSM